MADARAGGFKIVATSTGFQLVDMDTFNPWRNLTGRFDTIDHATDYAWACASFKCGHRMSLPENPAGMID